MQRENILSPEESTAADWTSTAPDIGVPRADGGRIDQPIRIARDAFLYMENPDNARFAQCGTCWLFRRTKQRCEILPPNFVVTAKDRCGYCLEGKPEERAHIDHKTTPDKPLFVRANAPRCQNC